MGTAPIFYVDIRLDPIDAPCGATEELLLLGFGQVRHDALEACKDRVIRTPAERVGRDSRRLGLRID